MYCTVPNKCSCITLIIDNCRDNPKLFSVPNKNYSILYHFILYYIILYYIILYYIILYFIILFISYYRYSKYVWWRNLIQKPRGKFFFVFQRVACRVTALSKCKKLIPRPSSPSLKEKMIMTIIKSNNVGDICTVYVSVSRRKHERNKTTKKFVCVLYRRTKSMTKRLNISCQEN